MAELIVIKRVGKAAVRGVIEGDLDRHAGYEQLRAIVGGGPESAITWPRLAGGTVRVFCNGDGRVCDPPLPLNFYRPTDEEPIHGDVFVMAVDSGGRSRGLTDAEALDAIHKLGEWSDDE